MMPGDGIGPEMMGYVREVFKEAGAPVDFELVELDPNTDNYDDLHNVIAYIFCSLNILIQLSLFHLRPFPQYEETVVESKVTSRQSSTGSTSNRATLKCEMNWTSL